jgi:hypothetical protein
LIGSASASNALNDKLTINSLINFNDTDYGHFPIPDSDPNDYFDYSVTEAFVRREISGLRRSISPGEDGLTVPILKNLVESISPAVTALFNRSIREDTFPSNWKSAKVVPIPKCSGATDLGSFRPISLLSILSKILERHFDQLIRSRIRFSEHQHGFCRRRGTNSALIGATQFIHDSINSKRYRNVVGVFLDIQKAFDKVPHSLLLRNLVEKHQIPSKIIRWVASYLEDRSQYVSINGCASASARIPSGVPQGSILGPTLFIAYFDPLLQDFKVGFPDLRLQAYADDLLLLIPVADIDDLDRFGQPALDFIEKWISAAGLSFNVSKTQVMVFCYGVLPKVDWVSLFLNGQKLLVATEVKYLGVLFSSDLKFSRHIFSTVKKANSMLGALNRKFGRCVSPDILKTVYESCVRSILEYGCVSWDPILKKDITELERAQFFALRLFYAIGTCHILKL